MDLIKALDEIPKDPYGSFSAEEHETLQYVKECITDSDPYKLSLLEGLIEAYVRNARNDEAFSNAGPDT